MPILRAMKFTPLFLALAAVVVAGTSTVVLTSASSDASSALQGPPPGKGGGEGGEHRGPPGGGHKGGAAPGDLEGSMQMMQGAMKKLDKAMSDKKDAATLLPLIADMEAAAQNAKSGTPEKVGEVEKDKKDEFMKGFRHQMIELQRALLDTEAAVIDGKMDDAAKAWDRVKAAKKDGHDKYKG